MLQPPTAHFRASVFRQFAQACYTAPTVMDGYDGPEDFEALAKAIKVKHSLLLKAVGEARAACYRLWHIPKRRGGTRILTIPPYTLKAVQRAIYRWLLRKAGGEVHPAAHGFVQGRSHATHASLHVGQAVVSSVDIQDFFGSVSDLHLWVALRRALPLAEPALLRAVIRLVTVEAPTHTADYQRTRTTLRLALLDGYVRKAHPTVSEILGDGTGLTPNMASLAAVILGAKPPTEPLHPPDPSWSPAARRMACFVQLYGHAAPASRYALLAVLYRQLKVPKPLRSHAVKKHKRHPSEPPLDRIRLHFRRSTGVGLWVKYVSVPHAHAVASPRQAAPPAAEVAMIPLAHRVLPQGAPTSPLLANLACFELDAWCVAYARDHDLRYSRYADDLAFSGEATPPGFVATIARRLEAEGLQLNRDKVSVQRRHLRQIVTGIVVNDRPSPTTLGRRKLRAMRHHLARGLPAHISDTETGERRELTDTQAQGVLAYWHMVDARRVPWPPE